MNSISRHIILAGFCVMTLSVARLTAQANSDVRVKPKVAEILKPGGRIVGIEALHDNLREAPREVQLKDREISPLNVGIELTEVGFSVIDVRPQFAPFTDPKQKGGYWLMIAIKPTKKL